MILGRGAWLLASGIAIGLAGTAAIGRVLDGFVWNVTTADPVTLAGVSALILIAGLQACVWPARRAARVNPVVAMRHD
jgi:ABC-type antimicrobial peptide transport system permease subunit